MIVDRLGRRLTQEDPTERVAGDVLAWGRLPAAARWNLVTYLIEQLDANLTAASDGDLPANYRESASAEYVVNRHALRLLQSIAPVRLDHEIDLPFCVGCGCTDDLGCADGCSWAAPGLCTSCADLKFEVLR